MPRYDFIEFSFDSETALLETRGGPKVLRKHTAHLLSLLLTHPGVVKSKQELIETIWPDTAVEESSLYQCITEVRSLLGDDPKQPRYIKNIPRKGYKWIGPEPLVSQAEKSHPDQGQPARAIPKKNIQSRLWIIAALSLVVVGWTAWFVFRPRAVPVPANGLRVAIFPFQNETGDVNQKWIELGLMDSLASALAEKRDLDVVSTRHVLQLVQDRQGHYTRLTAENVADFREILGNTHLISAQLRHEEQFAIHYQVWQGKGRVKEGVVRGETAMEAVEALTHHVLYTLGFPKIEDVRFPDTFTNEAYVQAREAQINREFKKAQRLFEVCSSQHPQSGYAKLGIAKCRIALKDFASSERLLKEILKIAETTNDLALKADAIHTQAVWYYFRRNYDLFDRTFRTALDLYELVGNEERTLERALKFGRLSIGFSNHETARTILNNILIQVKGRKLNHIEAECRFLLGRLAMAQGLFEPALAHFEAAVMLFEKLDSFNSRELAFKYVSDLAGLTGTYPERTQKLIQKAAGILDDTTQQNSKIASLLLFFHFHYHRFDWKNSQDALLNLMSSYKEVGDKPGLAWVSFYLIITHAKLQQWDTAEEALRQAVQLYTELSDPSAVADCHFEWANQTYYGGVYDKSETAYQKAIAAYPLSNDESKLLFSRIQYGFLLTTIGKFQEAFHQAQSANELAQTLKDTDAKTNLDILNLYLQIKTKHVEEVQPLLEKLDAYPNERFSMEARVVFLALKIDFFINTKDFLSVPEVLETLNREFQDDADIKNLTLYYHGVLAFYQGGFPKAKEQFEEVINLPSRDRDTLSKSYYYLAQIARQSKQWSHAEDQIKHALQINPFDFESALAAAHIAKELGHESEAMERSNQAKTLAHQAWTDELERERQSIQKANRP